MTIPRRRPVDRFEPNEISVRSDKALSWQSFLKSSSYSDFLEAGQIKISRVLNWGRRHDAIQMRR
jgi:hypothetical protein